MPKQPWEPRTIAPAFTRTLKKALKDPSLRKSLLDPDAEKVKEAFSDFAQIKVPPEFTIRFYPEEDLPINIAMAIPAAKGHTAEVPGNPKDPTFEACYLGFYNTYLRLNDYQTLSKIFGSKELRRLSRSKQRGSKQR